MDISLFPPWSLRNATERNGKQYLTWIDISFRSVPLNLYLVFNTPLEHCSIFPSHLFLPRSPLRSVRKWLVQHLNISLFQRSGAEWLWQWWEHHLNFAISSLAIYSYPVPRSAPLSDQGGGWEIPMLMFSFFRKNWSGGSPRQKNPSWIWRN